MNKDTKAQLLTLLEERTAPLLKGAKVEGTYDKVLGLIVKRIILLTDLVVLQTQVLEALLKEQK